MKYIFNNQKGAVLVMFALLLTMLVGFTSLAVEVGRWYLVRAELSKAVDAAALTAAQNISNPHYNNLTLGEQFGLENFPVGYLGTPGEGKNGAVNLTVERVRINGVDTTQFQAKGSVSVFPIFSALFGINTVVTGSSGVAQKNEVEIMMILDRSNSMGGDPIDALKSGALSFLSFFEDTQADDRMGLITYREVVSVDCPCQTNFVSCMEQRIYHIHAGGTTNIEDALDQADGPQGFTDQTGIPGDQRVRQFVIFFTDGLANKFRGKFTYMGGKPFDAVPFTDGTLHDPITGSTLSGVSALPTGDGDGKEDATTSPLCTGCASCHNTKWHVFSDRHVFHDYPVPGYGAEYCGIPQSALTLTGWWGSTARGMAIEHAQELKDKYGLNNGIIIYTIGLGSVDKDFLGQVASGPKYEYYTPTPDQLEAIFNAIAQEIKLRLVR